LAVGHVGRDQPVERGFALHVALDEVDAAIVLGRKVNDGNPAVDSLAVENALPSRKGGSARARRAGRLTDR
jgi:hypothetical protein